MGFFTRMNKCSFGLSNVRLIHKRLNLLRSSMYLWLRDRYQNGEISWRVFRRLTTELQDGAQRLFLSHYVVPMFSGYGLKIRLSNYIICETVQVTVYHSGFFISLLNSHGKAADNQTRPLTDTVRTIRITTFVSTAPPIFVSWLE